MLLDLKYDLPFDDTVRYSKILVLNQTSYLRHTHEVHKHAVH